MRPLAIRAAVNVAVKAEVDPPLYVCPPCLSSHGDWFPGPNYPSHERVKLTPFELELAKRLATAVRRGQCTHQRLELAVRHDEDLEDLAFEVERLQVVEVTT